MIDLDLWRSGQVRDGPVDFQDPVICAGTEMEVCHGLFEQIRAALFGRLTSDFGLNLY